MREAPVEYNGVNAFCDECRGTIWNSRYEEFYHCEACGWDVCRWCAAPSVRNLKDLEKHDIGKIALKVYFYEKTKI